MSNDESLLNKCLGNAALKAAAAGVVCFGAALVIAPKFKVPAMLYGAGFGTGLARTDCCPLYSRIASRTIKD